MDSVAGEIIVPIANRILDLGVYTIKSLTTGLGAHYERHKALLAYARTSRDVLDLLSVQKVLNVNVHSFLYSGLSSFEVDAIVRDVSKPAAECEDLHKLLAASLILPDTRARLYKNFLGNRSIGWMGGPLPLDSFTQLELGLQGGEMHGVSVAHRLTKPELRLLDCVRTIFNKNVGVEDLQVGKALGALSHRSSWDKMMEVAPWEKGVDVLRVCNGAVTSNTQLIKLLDLTVGQLLKLCKDENLAFGLSTQQLEAVLAHSEGSVTSEYNGQKISQRCERLEIKDGFSLQGKNLRFGAIACGMLIMGMQVRALEACHISRGYPYSAGACIVNVVVDFNMLDNIEVTMLSLDDRNALGSVLCDAKLAPEWTIYQMETLHAMDKRLQDWICDGGYEFATTAELRHISGRHGTSVDKMVTVAELVDKEPLYGSNYNEQKVLITKADIPLPREALTILMKAIKNKYASSSNNKLVRVKESTGVSLQGITLDPLLGIQSDDKSTIFNALSKGRSELQWLGACHDVEGGGMTSSTPDMLYTSARERMVAYLPGNFGGTNAGFLAQNALQPLYLHVDTYAVRRAATRMHSIVGCDMVGGMKQGPMYKSVKKLAEMGSLYSRSGRDILLNDARGIYKEIKVSHVQTLAARICTSGDTGNLERSYTASIAREILHDLIEAGEPDERPDDSQHDCYFRAVCASNMYADKAPLNTLHCNDKVMLAGTQAGMLQVTEQEMGMYLAEHRPIDLDQFKDNEGSYIRKEGTNVRLRIGDGEPIRTSTLLSFQIGGNVPNNHFEKRNRSANLRGIWSCRGDFRVGSAAFQDQ